MNTSAKLPRIAIAGMAIESSTFSPHRAGERDFAVATGAELLNRYDAIREGTLGTAAEWIPVHYARSIPGGAVLREVYEGHKAAILAGLTEAVATGPLDGLFFDIHGAMSVDGLDDAEGDLIRAVREVIGQDTLVSASMDLHGNVSRDLIENVNLITCYRLAPHEDTWETRDRALTNLVNALEARNPALHTAWVRVPILLPGEKTSTRVEPAKSLYRRIDEIETRPGVIDAAIWIGYAWADEPRCHGTVVVSGTDEAQTAAAAEELGRAFWDARDDFEFVGPPGTLDEGVAAGLAATKTPYLISDSGDNPGAGGTGDVTWTLARLLDMPELTAEDAPLTYVGSIFDAAALAELRTLNAGDPVDITAGAGVDSGPAGPVRIVGTLESLTEGDPDGGGIAVIRVGGIRAIVTEFRKAYHATSDYAQIGLDPHQAQIIVTKIGYLEPTLYDIAEGWTLALTPGGVDQDLERLGHHRIQRPMFPFDDFATDPDLRAEIIR